MENKSEKSFQVERDTLQDECAKPVLALMRMFREDEQKTMSILENFCEENCGAKGLRDGYEKWMESGLSVLPTIIKRNPDDLIGARYLYVSSMCDYLHWTGQK